MNAVIHGLMCTVVLALTVLGNSRGSAGSSKCHSISSASPKQCKCEPGTPCRGIVGHFSGGWVFGVLGVSGVRGCVLCPTLRKARQEAHMAGPRRVDALLQRTRE